MRPERKSYAAATKNIRLLWDEQLSPSVPKALQILGFRTSYVGSTDDEQPVRGSSDREIVAHARRTNQIIVTSNHDMMLICAEANLRFVWIDPRGRKLTKSHQVLLVFEQIEEWQLMLKADPASCIRALRTKCYPIVPSEAARLAKQRMRELSRRRRKKTPIGHLETDLFTTSIAKNP